MSSFLSVAPTLLVLGIVIAVTLVTIWHVSVMRIEKFVDEMENMTERGCDSKRVQFFSNMEVRRRVNERQDIGRTEVSVSHCNTVDEPQWQYHTATVDEPQWQYHTATVDEPQWQYHTATQWTNRSVSITLQHSGRTAVAVSYCNT